MIRALYSAASGMTAQQLNVDNIANNLANASTIGFKMHRAQFQDLLYQTVVQPGAAAGQRRLPVGPILIRAQHNPGMSEILLFQLREAAAGIRTGGRVIKADP